MNLRDYAERFELVRRLATVASANHASNFVFATRQERDVALRCYVEAVDAIAVELAALERAGVLGTVSASLRAREGGRELAG